MNWKYVASDDRLDYRDHFVTERSRHYIAAHVIGQANNLIKSLLRPRFMLSYSSHHGVWADRTVVAYRLIQGGIHRYAHNSSGYRDDPMWADHNHHGIATIVHYHFKSSKEFLLRLYRGDALDPFSRRSLSVEMLREDWIQTFNAQHGQFGDPIPADRQLASPELRAEVDRLLLLPGVRSARQAIQRIVDGRIDLMIDFMRENRDRLGPDATLLLDRILAHSETDDAEMASEPISVA